MFIVKQAKESIPFAFINNSPKTGLIKHNGEYNMLQTVYCSVLSSSKKKRQYEAVTICAKFHNLPFLTK